MRRFNPPAEKPKPLTFEQQRRIAESIEDWLAGRPQKRYGYVPPLPFHRNGGEE